MIQERKYTEKRRTPSDNTTAPKASTLEKQQPTQSETITEQQPTQSETITEQQPTQSETITDT